MKNIFFLKYLNAMSKWVIPCSLPTIGNELMVHFIILTRVFSDLYEKLSRLFVLCVKGPKVPDNSDFPSVSSLREAAK